MMTSLRAAYRFIAVLVLAAFLVAGLMVRQSYIRLHASDAVVSRASHIVGNAAEQMTLAGAGEIGPDAVEQWRRNQVMIAEDLDGIARARVAADFAGARRLLAWSDELFADLRRVEAPAARAIYQASLNTVLLNFTSEVKSLQRQVILEQRLAMERMLRVLILAGLAILLITAVAGDYLRRRILKPLDAVGAAIQAYGAGRREARAPRVGLAELDVLAGNFNRTADRLDATTVSRDALEAEVVERVRVEKELRENEKRLSEAQRIARIGHWELDHRNGVLHWSDETHRIFEIDPAHFGATYAAFLAAVHPEDRDRVDAAYVHSLETHEPYSHSHRLRMPDGRIKYVHEQCETRFDPDGQPIQSTGTMQDITERMLVEQELKRSNAELEQFAYAISHDMRQPLRMVSSYLQLIDKAMRGRIDADTRQYLAYALEGARRMDGMILALLNFSRVGRKSDPMALLPIRDTLDEALTFLGPELDADAGTVAVSGDWPALVVSRDEMVRVFQNLVGNALKYHDEGAPPRVDIVGRALDRAWRCEVRDQGVGIEPTQIARLFHVFARLQSRARFDGSGVGLALCRKIIEHHGGRIGAESEGEGKGSTFWFELPLNAAPRSPEASPP